MIKFTAPEDRVIRSDKVTEKVTDRVTEKVTEKVTDGERMLLRLLAEDPGYTMLQLSEKIGVSRKTIALRLKKLKDSGAIERVGSDYKGYWKVK